MYLHLKLQLLESHHQMVSWWLLCVHYVWLFTIIYKKKIGFKFTVFYKYFSPAGDLELRSSSIEGIMMKLYIPYSSTPDVTGVTNIPFSILTIMGFRAVPAIGEPSASIDLTGHETAFSWDPPGSTILPNE